MDYQWHYDQLILTRKNRITENGVYYETHHIIPKSMGGNNTDENLISLTAREHFIAHWLLWRIHRNRQTAFAFFCMQNWKNKKTQGSQRCKSARSYQEAREAYSKFLSEFQSGKKKKFAKRRPHSDETKLKQSQKKLGIPQGPISDTRSKKLKAHFDTLRKDSIKTRLCESCKSEFEFDSRSHDTKFCSKKCSSGASNKNKKKVEVIDLRTNEIVVYESIYKAAKELKINRSQIYSYKQNEFYNFKII